MEGGSEPARKIDSYNGGEDDEKRVPESDEEFYERIEAPKFVDFTLPDIFRPDDRFWFCSRVGCDQKHEEEIDPEEISKNFVLRVMAARSPNIKLRRVLNGKSSSMNRKCPLSAPAKQPKSRVSKLALVSSISHKVVDPKEKVRPPSVLCSTPMAKSKPVAAKYMTTPRRKKSLPTSNSFRSVQNPKPTSVIVPKNRMVAKALVFHSPKKGISVKSSVELHTPLTKICEGMKRLEITSQKKRVLGYSSKSSKDIKSNPKKLFTKDTSGRRASFLKGRRVSFLNGKRRTKKSLPPQNHKDREAQSSRGMKTKRKKNLAEQGNSNSVAGKDSSDIEIDVKLRDDSIVNSPMLNGGNGNKEHLPTLERTENFCTTYSTQEEEVVMSYEDPTSRAEMNSIQNAEEKSVEGTDLPRVQELKIEVHNGKDGKVQDINPNKSSENFGNAKVHKEDSVLHMGLRDTDDKENVLNPDNNRDINCDNHQSVKKILGSQESLIKKKVTRAADKNMKDTPLSAAACPIVVKYKKPKLTNPKPFRLRTDERGILKEANLERKLHGNGLQKNGDHPIEQSKCNDETCEAGRNESERSLLKDEPGSTACHKVSRAKHQEPQYITSPLGSAKVNVTQKSKKSLSRTRSPYLQRDVVSPQGVASTRKAASYARCGQQLSVINETSKITIPAKVGMDRNCAIGAKTTTAPSASRSTSRGKRPVTIPKEPNFNSSHLPKSCTRNIA